jgi:flagellar protein FlbD
MVKLGRINGAEVTVNAEMIETIEATPDTIVTLSSGKKLMVVESVEGVIEKVMAYRRSLLAPARDCGHSACEAGEGVGDARLRRPA